MFSIIFMSSKYSGFLSSLISSTAFSKRNKQLPANWISMLSKLSVTVNASNAS